MKMELKDFVKTEKFKSMWDKKIDDGWNVVTSPDSEDESFVIISDGYDGIGKFVEEVKEFAVYDEYDRFDIDQIIEEYFDVLVGSDHWGFYDEWDYCHQCNKAIRTSPTSYGWKPDYHIFYEAGEILCGDCIREEHIDEYLNDIINDPDKSVTLLDDSYLLTDWTKYGEYESGWYGSHDNPHEIATKIWDEFGLNTKVLFKIDNNEQFSTTFSAWYMLECKQEEEE